MNIRDRSFPDTLDRVIQVVPESEHELRAELEAIRKDCFLVLPELARDYWLRAGIVLQEYLEDRSEPWVEQLFAIWQGEAR